MSDEQKVEHPVTGLTKTLGELVGNSLSLADRSQQEMYEAAAEVRKYEGLLASARERHELAQQEYRTMRGLLQIGWEQLKADIQSEKG